MDTAAIDGNHDVRGRNVVIQIETDEGVRSRNEHTLQVTNGVPSSLYPLINSMRPFGIYFTRNPRTTSAATNQLSGIRGCSGWSRARFYATFMLIVTWFNAARNCVIFDGTETQGAHLFTKLGTISAVLLIGFLHTTYYVASHTGSLDTVFHQMNLSTNDFSVKFSRRAKMVTVICWLLIATGVCFYAYRTFTTEAFHDFSLSLIIRTFRLSKIQAGIVKIVCVMLQLQAAACWAFTQAMKHIFRFSTTLFIPNLSSF